VKEKALMHIATHGAKTVELLRRFNALRDDA
jgi:hypothetical protein